MEKQEQLFLNFQVIGSSKKLVPQAHDMEAGWCMVFATLEGLSRLQLSQGHLSSAIIGLTLIVDVGLFFPNTREQKHLPHLNSHLFIMLIEHLRVGCQC